MAASFDLGSYDLHMKYLCLTRDLSMGPIVKDGLIISRNPGGLGYVFGSENCRHRGMPVCLKTLKCPYHGLAWKHEGQCLVVGDGLLFAVDDLDNFSCRQLHGAAEVRLGREFQTVTMDVRAPWHLWMQNVMDPNHLSFVHPEFSQQFPEGAKPFDVLINSETSSYRMPVREDVVLRWKRLYASCSDSFFQMTIGPSLSLTSFLGLFSSVEEVVKLGPDTCRVTTRYFDTPDNPLSDGILRAARAANLAILAEDRALVEKWARSYDLRQELWLAGEERIQSFLRRWT